METSYPLLVTHGYEASKAASYGDWETVFAILFDFN